MLAPRQGGQRQGGAAADIMADGRQAGGRDLGTLDLRGPGATLALAGALAGHLAPGDCVLLSGAVGAGKSHLARGIISALLARDGRTEDIPSPSFTLVQAYDTAAGAVWHVDLYRLSGPDDAAELGLAEAFAEAVTLVEWPDRLGAVRPGRWLSIDLATDAADEERRIAHLRAVGDWPWLPAMLSGVLADLRDRVPTGRLDSDSAGRA
jgi:tRNA threonylcarbamoyladenosine biosynthesis protein TsaE